VTDSINQCAAVINRFIKFFYSLDFFLSRCFHKNHCILKMVFALVEVVSFEPDFFLWICNDVEYSCLTEINRVFPPADVNFALYLPDR